MRLRGVTDDVQRVLSRQFADRIHVGGLTIEVHRDNCLRLRRDLLFDALDLDVARLMIDVHEHHLRSRHPDGF